MKKNNVIQLDSALFEKEREVFLYRQAGLTFDQIANKLGYSHPSGAHAAFKRAVERTRDESLATAGRKLHRARLETALSAIWNKVLKGDLRAIAMMIRILDADAKLYGLYMPVKTEMEVTSYDGNLLRQRTREIVQTIRELTRPPDSVGNGASETGTVTE